jgi:hypothetical protein
MDTKIMLKLASEVISALDYQSELDEFNNTYPFHRELELIDESHSNVLTGNRPYEIPGYMAERMERAGLVILLERGDKKQIVQITRKGKDYLRRSREAFSEI